MRTDAAKQRTVAYLSGRGQRRQMFLPPGADNPSYARSGSAHAAASVCLYREQERPLTCRADSPAVSDGGPGVSCTWRMGPVGGDRVPLSRSMSAF